MLRRRSRVALLAILAVTACVGPRGRPGSSASTPVAAGTPLLAGAPIERALLAGQTHAYSVLVPPDHVVAGTIDQRGVDVVVRIIAPDRRVVATIDSPNDAHGPEPWTLEPTPPGRWSIEVEALGPHASGHYQARLDEQITTREHAERRARLRHSSPRLLQLWRDHNQNGAAAIETFSAQLAGHAPLVEPIAGDPHGDVLTTFAWRGEPTGDAVWLLGGPITPNLESPMQRFEGTDLWTLTVRAPRDLRIVYNFRPGPDAPAGIIPDPWNPRRMGMGSLLELPDAPAQPWIAPDERAPRGRVVTTTLPSTALAEDRQIGVYLPANLADAAGPHPYVIVFDGEVHGLKPDPLVPVPVILDNLIAQARLPPTLAVLVASGATRTRDLSMSPAFCEFLADELAPWLRQEYRASANPADVTLAGSSLGGLTAAYCAFHRSHTFGNVLSQSGSFWFAPGAWDSKSPHTLETGGFMREVIAAPRKPVRFWLEVGRFEGGGVLPGANQVAQNRHLRDVLRLQGYEVDYHEYAGGHDYFSWRGSFADGLLELASTED